MSKRFLTRGMVLAAGLGLRMRPITRTLPKALVQVIDKSLLDHVLDRLKEAGVTNVVINVHYLAPLIEQHVKKYTDINIQISDERTQLLETGGGVMKALPLLGKEPFFVTNSDVLLLNGNSPALKRMLDVWDAQQMDLLLLLQPVMCAFGYNGPGDFLLNQYGQLIRRGRLKSAPYLFAGVQILKPELFTNIPEGSFSLNLIYDRAIAANRAFGIVHDGEWFHIGNPDALLKTKIYLNRYCMENEYK